MSFLVLTWPDGRRFPIADFKEMEKYPDHKEATLVVDRRPWLVFARSAPEAIAWAGKVALPMVNVFPVFNKEQIKGLDIRDWQFAHLPYFADNEDVLEAAVEWEMRCKART